MEKTSVFSIALVLCLGRVSFLAASLPLQRRMNKDTSRISP